MRRPSLRTLAAAMVVGSLLLVGPATSPPPVVGVGPLPACRLDDILTVPRGYDDWSTTLVDWLLSVGPDYTPPDLVSVHKAGLNGGGLIRKVALADLTALAKAAKANGTPLSSWSAYRGYDQQVKLFNIYAGWNATKKTYSNFDDAIKFSHRPGHSEHQLGLTIDFVAVGDTHLTTNWEVTRTGGWMAKNAWKYGWVMSYPKVSFETICFNYEPWHYRYVGRDMAKKIHDSGLTTREYLWANVTQVDPACVALPAPKVTTPGVPRSCAIAEASPSIPPTAGSTASPAAPTLPSTTQLPPGPTPAATLGPASPAGTWFGLDPVVVVALGLIVLASVGLALSLRRGRRAG
jgi:D-alanyl-D-alanine carboxypeptidase